MANNQAFMQLIGPTVLFIALAPGFLLTIPGDRKPIETGADNQKVRPAQVLTHAGVFAGAYYGWLRFMSNNARAVRKP
ncbi:hypothetical protein KFL_004330070 [Klebsormidium nitens]|uniref:Uncharacterized protein n=1 Tax=Klebsormidium nitens TaxID=105231 RepID=A0A1Y1IC48_KLENI|nr:hypothetical protein KFL_004330070 [Klebsormidium nitens]|eukprot:GAQ88490.1 hypothetical protein KFL_004330070 [Klebsormidium nitens]